MNIHEQIMFKLGKKLKRYIKRIKTNKRQPIITNMYTKNIKKNKTEQKATLSNKNKMEEETKEIGQLTILIIQKHNAK